MLKDLIKELEAAEEKTNMIDDLLEADPENEEVNAEWAAAYEKEFRAAEAVERYIVALTGVKPQVARAMMATKRDELKAIAEKEVQA